MDKILFYLPYPLRSMKSGSTVRPRKMLKAFRDYCSNHEIELLEIYGESKERREKLKRLYTEIDPKDILFCYMENSTLPFWLTDKDHLPRSPLLELNLFSFLKKNNVPLGLFYRDIYWKFDDEYPLKGIKKIVMRAIYRVEYLLYTKYVNHFFLPSLEMNTYAQFPKERTSNLPPGGENLIQYRKDKGRSGLNIIYVGGISENYGLLEMLEATSSTYEKNKEVKLHLVCRENEYERHSHLFERYKDKHWLKIYHASGEQLSSIYSGMDIAIIPRRKNTYNDFAVPVKLFEYISYGLPIISTNCKAQATIINEFKLGIVVEDGVEGIRGGIEFFLNEANKQKYVNHVETALVKENTWIHRAEKVAGILKKRNLNVE